MLLRHGLIYLVARLVPGAVAFTSLVVYTRLLSPEDYGAYILVITTVSLVQVLLFRWLELSLLRMLPAAQESPGTLLGTVLALYLLLVTATGAVGLVAWMVLPDPVMGRLLLLGIPILWTHAWMELNLKLCQSALMPIRYGILMLLRSASTLCLGVALVWYGLGAYGPLLGFLVGTAAACMLAVAWQWRGVRPALDRRVVGELARYGLPLTGSIALVFVIDSADRFMIARFLGADSVGVYAAASDLASQSLQVLMMVVNLAATPLAIRAYESGGVEAAISQLRENANFLLAIAVPAATGIVVLAGPLADVLLGADYRAAARLVLPWVALAVFLAGLKVFLFDISFQLGKRSGTMLWSVAFGAMANVLLNLAWIPQFGVIGAAWASVASYALALVICIALGRRIVPIRLDWGEVGRIAIATLSMAAVLVRLPEWPGPAGLAASIVAGMATYGLAFIASNAMGSRTRLMAYLARV